MICINNSVPECVKFWIVTRWEIQGCEVGEDIRHEIVLRRGETDRELVCEFHDPILNEKMGMSRPHVPEIQVSPGGWIFYVPAPGLIGRLVSLISNNSYVIMS